MWEQVGNVLGAIWLWMTQNRDWLFSGAGITACAVVFGLIGRARRTRREKIDALERQIEERARGKNGSLISPSHEDRMKYDPEYRKLHVTMHMKSTSRDWKVRKGTKSRKIGNVYRSRSTVWDWVWAILVGFAVSSLLYFFF